jgi:trimeric autotransporter adhesin
MRRRQDGGQCQWRIRAATLVFFGAAIGLMSACEEGDETPIPPLPASAPADASADHSVPEAGDARATVADASVADGDADAGVAVAEYSSTLLDLGTVSCSSSGTGTFAVNNGGSAMLVVTAATTGSAFSVSPTLLDVAPGSSGSLTVTATVPGSSTAGTALTGSLNVFTNDPAHASAIVPLSATPSGATIVFTGSTRSALFPSTPVGSAATPIALTFTNSGNASASVALGAPSDPQFTLSAQGGATAEPLAAGDTLTANAGFVPTSVVNASATATATVSVTGVTCGSSVSSFEFSGDIGHGAISGWPSAAVDFGSVDCGGSAPPPQGFTLSNTGSANVTITAATITGATGFATTAQGAIVPAGGTYLVQITAPAVPVPSPTTPITATLSVQTSADTSTQTITLTEEPSGAVLAFDTSATTNFGSFGQIVLLQAEQQTFSVTNQGNASATISLDTGDSDGGTAQPFTVSNASFSIAAGGTQSDSIVFSPTTANTDSGQLTLAATGAICSALPAPLPLTGFGIGGGPSVTPTSLAFSSACGGAAAPAQTFTVGNDGSANLNWAMSAVTGVGSADYTVTASPEPGLLAPGASAQITVTPAAIPSPASNPLSSAYAAQITITTDVPFDNPHVVTLGDTPLGDQLSFSQGSLRFGQFPIDDTTLPLAFTITNNANAGSPAANLALLVVGSNATAYGVSPASVSNLAPDAVSSTESVTFDPSSAVAYPASIAISTRDSLCTALPAPIQLSGTGTEGKVAVSETAMAFGTDARDPDGLVNCGAAGLAHGFTISNLGNSLFHVTGLTLGLGASSPYALSGAGTLPAEIPIAGSTTITITPSAIPADVANPNDPSPFTDTLTITTDAAMDSPHTIALHMQARGAIIASTSLATTWNFGTVGGGSIGTFANTITNTGNASASVAFTGLDQPTIFGLQSNPTIAAANAVTPVVGTFSPPSSDGQWSDQGTLTVTATQAFCEPLPATWTNPAISVSGSSNASPPVTLSGTLAFPTTNCGSAAPASQAITLTNNTDQNIPFTTAFVSGVFYTANPAASDAGVDASFPDGGTGTIPANGSATILVTPITVTPGAGVRAGSSAYVDDLLVTLQSTPAASFTVPISWTLNGAVFSLPDGLGTARDPSNALFYPADTQSGFQLPLANTGTGAATVSFGMQPSGAFAFSPAPPITVEPGITALPVLSSSSTDATCPNLTAGSVTFLYSGPVCQPLPYPQVNVESCVGAY